MGMIWGDRVHPTVMSPQLLPSSWFPASTLERPWTCWLPRLLLPPAGLRGAALRSPLPPATNAPFRGANKQNHLTAIKEQTTLWHLLSKRKAHLLKSP